MKKLIYVFALFLWYGQAMGQSSFADFIKTVSFLKESAKHSLYKNQHYGSPEKEPYYILGQDDKSIEIKNITRQDGNVVSFEMSFGSYCTNEVIKPNDPIAPTYWAMKDTRVFLVMYKEYLIFLSKDPSLGDSYIIDYWCKQGATSIKDRIKAMSYIDKQKSLELPFTKEELAAHLKPFVDAKKVALAKAEEERKAREAAHRAQYSIKGKTVTKIEIVNTFPRDFVVGSKFTFGMIATLADGSQIKTKALGGEGYIDDYNVVMTGSYIKNWDSYEVGIQWKDVSGDYILIEANSIHHPALKKVSAKMVLTYNQPLRFDYSGTSTTMEGDNADNLRIELKTVEHSETGGELLEYRIYTSKGLDKAFRIQPTQLVEVKANGGNSGSRGISDLQNLRGGNAGNISLYIEPSVGEDYIFEYSNNGGKGGSNSKAFTAADGSNGTFTKKVQAIK